MKILSIEEHELGGLTINYRDGNNEFPYHLTDAMNGPFASKIRALITSSDAKIKPLKDVLSERSQKQERIDEISQSLAEKRKLERERKNKTIADAILTGDRDSIIEALSQ